MMQQCVIFSARPHRDHNSQIVYYRMLSSKHDALVHLGDDTEMSDGVGVGDDKAANTRRKEGILINLPKFSESVRVVVFSVCCYTDETCLAEAAGAEMRISVGHSDADGLRNDLVRYYLTSER